MAAGKLDIIIERGATFRLRYFVKSGGATTGRPLTVAEALALDPFDLTGFTATAQVRESPESTTVLATMTCTIESPATDGAIHMTIDYLLTTPLPKGIQHWDCFLNSAGTGPFRLLYGRASVDPTVTR